MKTIIPEAALQQHIAVLGKTGSGKTFAVKGIIEGLLSENRRVGIIDPTGAWWGLRSSRDGKGAGFPILVLGGDHGDLPLPSLGGAAVARLLTDQAVNLVADTSHLTIGERTRWFIDFANTLHRTNKGPLHLVLDEAHNFAPQGKVLDPDAGKMLHAANRLAAEGRSRGIRLAMITQRPQKLHKDTLTSADTLIALRVLAPHDRQAVKDWIEGCGDIQQGKEVLNSLANLKRGEGWAWYPEGGFLQRLTFPPIKTFDSSATPTDGGPITAPKGAAEIDLTEIRAAMADAVREAEANDPKLLRAEIAKLKREVEKQPEQVDRAALVNEYARGLQEGTKDGTQKTLARIRPLVHAAQEALERLNNEMVLEVVGELKPVLEYSPPAQPRVRVTAAQEGLPKAERLILTALAQYPQGRSKTQVAILAGYATNGGSFNNSIGALRSSGRIERSGDRLKITDIGLRVLGPYDPLPHGKALLDHWLRQLGKAERKALEALAEVYPRTLSKVQIASRAGYEPDGGSFNNALGKLRTLELIEGRGELKASDNLFG